ncbi:MULTISPECIES: tRNA (N(6)-L-threonylcarbamoyladenosine(37)-C(2))-methylthiotransferase MtaB [unclassified Sedimentibacter]|uniref:tRNA (N(6)-L-threonylcarbamoyladenosine(37)-C(2))- methylthiotransferase MtaB n=1 Tax=unclassified Sedimentibacter TaxID=2649220 RepID=UPI0027DF3E92|nr:tRNA (N(6)-L-threonylcarbamoyladenosine(37)-C(2))-methylthiotransferase MtaB [Sedimentibacter sp. MB35-C1]WMJ76279.1 tRNA (N(6)-L-threonylcarbamoyladenosine(37)-C(2))-methylthiotransferase MtaB [Sedimentibacter sp. MB35-C1]
MNKQASNIKEKYTVSFTTLGCKVNQFETEAMTELLEQEGFVVVPQGELSDIYIINTCAVTKESERKSRQFINKAKRMNPEAVVVAVGCSVQLNGEKLSRETDVDIIIGTKHKSNIGKLIKERLKDIKYESQVEEFYGREDYEELKISTVHDKTRANIKIQDGCSQFCSYCIIPYVRGPIRSRSHDYIVEEVSKVASNGYKEIVLNGIHISSYGKDFHEQDALIKLIEDINEIKGIERIRLGSLEPKLITEDFVKRYSTLDKTCDHFHLSLQSGSDYVLKRMNRKYTAGEYQNNVELIRKYMPEAGITTDIIVGFPGETDEEFNETVEFVKAIKFSRIHVFKYSVREGTKAAEMKSQVNEALKSQRSRTLIDLADSFSRDFMKKFEGKTIPVLVETEKKENIFEGYTTNYLKVLLKSDINIKNKIVNAHIKCVKNDYLWSE